MPSKHSPSNYKGNNTAYIEGLDTLRGIAILLVLLYHCTPEDNPNLGLSSLVFKVASIGWAGVDLFFVLSGFLICRMLLSLKEQNRPFSIFFWNRQIRIAPIYYLVLFGALIAAPYLFDQEGPSLNNTYQFWLYISNITNLEYVEFYNLKVSLGHFWSLSLEMQFYLLFPILRPQHNSLFHNLG